MEIRARFTSNGNIKLGKKMGVWSTLMGDDTYNVKINGVPVSVKGTCGGHCAGCKGNCYVKKSYRYPSVVLGHARNTLAIRNTEKCFQDLDGQLNRKRVPFEQIRIDQSGEIENKEQFAMWCTLAAKHPETVFYIYTKNYDVVIPALLAGNVPENMTVLISIWHKFGVNEFEKVKNLPNVKAFVYDDNYKYGFVIDTYCKAYDEHGKLDHNITCDKCKKCFNRLNNCKVIGCKAH